MLLAAQTASQARLEVELRQDGRLQFLQVRSLVDPAQSFLLPLPAGPVTAGLAHLTRLGRWHALHWALAYGRACGDTADRVAVRFEESARPLWRPVTVERRWLADDCWVADAEGVFDTAVLVAAGGDRCHLSLADHW